MATRDPAYAMQKAVRAALVASADLTDVFGTSPRVYDEPPADSDTRKAVFPYITIGDDQFIGERTQNTDGCEAFVKVEAWSRAVDYGEVKRLAGAVRAALDDELQLDGHGIVTHEFHNATYRKEPDGKTRRAIIEFHYHTVPVSNPPYA